MTKIIYCYPEYLTEIPTDFQVPVHYYPGMPDTEFMSKLPDGSLLILDDMMIECSKCEDIAKLFSVVARNICYFNCSEHLSTRSSISQHSS